MEVEMEIETEDDMDAPILQHKYMGVLRAPVYVDGQISASISTSISTSNLISISTSQSPGTTGHSTITMKGEPSNVGVFAR